MNTHLLDARAHHAGVRLGVSSHWAWLGIGFAVAFALPFVFTDLVAIDRDLFYGSTRSPCWA